MITIGVLILWALFGAFIYGALKGSVAKVLHDYDGIKYSWIMELFIVFASFFTFFGFAILVMLFAINPVAMFDLKLRYKIRD